MDKNYRYDITPEQPSKFGSPNISLKRNFERRHIYKGVYIIHESLKEGLESYLPVRHLKVSEQCLKELKEAIKTIAELDIADDEDSDQFIGWIWEYKGIKDFSNPEGALKVLSYIGYLNARIIYINVSSMKLILRFLKGYLEYYSWSMKPNYEGYNTQQAYYSSERFLRLKILHSNIKKWIEFEAISD